MNRRKYTNDPAILLKEEKKNNARTRRHTILFQSVLCEIRFERNVCCKRC